MGRIREGQRHDSRIRIIRRIYVPADARSHLPSPPPPRRGLFLVVRFADFAGMERVLSEKFVTFPGDTPGNEFQSFHHSIGTLMVPGYSFGQMRARILSWHAWRMRKLAASPKHRVASRLVSPTVDDVVRFSYPADPAKSVGLFEAGWDYQQIISNPTLSRSFPDGFPATRVVRLFGSNSFRSTRLQRERKSRFYSHAKRSPS